jgi:SAM-dependent methyltransferase
MAQPLIRSFVAELAGMLELPDPVVEFGSLQVEPDQDGDLRPLFRGRDYVGTDFREGPGVDRVEDLRALTFADGEVGTALCLDTLEHCEDPPRACRELVRVTARDGGVCVISSVMLFGIHGYPNDYFRFTPEGFRALLSGFDDAWVAGVGHPDIPMQVIGVGMNGRRLGLAFECFPSLVAAQRRLTDTTGKVPVGVFNYQPRELVRLLARESPRLVRERLRRGR